MTMIYLSFLGLYAVVMLVAAVISRKAADRASRRCGR